MITVTNQEAPDLSNVETVISWDTLQTADSLLHITLLAC